MAYFKLKFVERSKIGTLFDIRSSLKASIDYYNRVFSVNSLERALLHTLIAFRNMDNVINLAAQDRALNLRTARSEFETWNKLSYMERTDFKIVNAFVSRLDIRVSVVLTQMVKNELYHARQTVDALHILNETLYSVEQKFKLERIEELEHDIRDARKRLDSALDEKVKLDERVKIMENQQRILHQEYDAIFNSDQQKEKELEKAEKKRKKLAKKLEDARERLNNVEGKRECVICLDANITMAFMPCGHMCVCKECAEKYIHAAPCPICRKPVGSYVEIFMS